ncbi:bacteriorhodopsin [Podospora appendiculata]|uniref:Bacteriorhodopsin n=1 Tax=Podospora appendiculata TaxID=314037 RepID=A0AAE1CGV7_9PEZI|nr:bacteriorhodopsin [Podospora appendiculata]
MSGNQALNTNAGVSNHADLEITQHGSDWLYTVCALMGTASLLFWGLSFAKPHHHRQVHHILAGLTLVSCIAYFTMGSNLGQTPIAAEWTRTLSPAGAVTREIFYVRYIDWFVTTPLLLLALFLTGGASLSVILTTVFADWVMVICFLVGALVRTRYKWGYWTFATASLFFVAWQVLWAGRKHAAALGSRTVYRAYLTAAALLLVPWLLYPVAWGLAEGGNIIHPDSEAVFYGVLDIVSKIGFGAVLLVLSHKIVDSDVVGGGGGSPYHQKGKGCVAGQPMAQQADHQGVVDDYANGSNLSSRSTAARRVGGGEV